ncbi:hypothetical protein A2U01_0118269, partial [Trifolium medium]|nr:hypothetical protein [Trifolium medium]
MPSFMTNNNFNGGVGYGRGDPNNNFNGGISYGRGDPNNNLFGFGYGYPFDGGYSNSGGG